jgi:hypothetical protein
MGFTAGLDAADERKITDPVDNGTVLGGVPVPTAWRVLGLRMEERPPAMEVS